MLFPGEEQAVKAVLGFAETYGYGNLIAHLRRAWALKLMRGNKRLSYKQAVKFTNSDAYPQNFNPFKKE